MQTHNQSYAIEAHKHVEEVSKKTPEEKSKYKTVCEKLPILIRTSGLAQALAFASAKAPKEKAWESLLEHLKKTLEGRDIVTDSRNPQLQLSEYMKLTRDVLSALLWYKRFSQSLLSNQKEP